MDINVTIHMPDLTNAVQVLATVLSSRSEVTPAAVPSGQATESTDQAQSEKPKRQRRAAQSDVAEQPSQPAQEEQTSDTEQKPQKTDVPTVVELRAKAQEIGKTPEAKKAIKALLDQFGSKSISDVPEEKRADFLSELDLI